MHSPTQADVSPNKNHTGGSTTVLLLLEQLVVDPMNPRTDPGDCLELAESIAERGLLQELRVRPREDGRYGVVCGSRRLKAAAIAGLTHVPCSVVQLDDLDAAIDGGAENLSREDLDPVTEAELYRDLLDRTGLPQDVLAGKLGVAAATLSQRLKLLELPLETRDQVRDGTMSLQAAYHLVKKTRGALSKPRRRRHEITRDDVDVLEPVVLSADLVRKARERARDGRNEPLEDFIARAVRREISEPSCERCTNPSLAGGRWCRPCIAQGAARDAVAATAKKGGHSR